MLPEYEKLLADFTAEVEELLEKVETNLLDLENGFDVTKVHTIFRCVHTVKGNSGMFEFENIRNLSHKLESILDKIRSEKLSMTKELMDIMLQSVDRLKSIVRNLKDEKSAKIDDLLTRLENYKEEEKESLPTLEETLELTENNSLKEDYSDYTNLAKQENRELLLIDINLAKQKFKTLYEFNKVISDLPATIVWKGIRQEEIPLLESKDISLPYRIIFMPNSPLDLPTILSYFKVDSQQSLFQPEKKVQTISADANNSEDKKEQKNTKTDSASSSGENFIKVKINLLDDLINLVGETIITRNQLLQRASILNDSEGSVILSRMSQLITQLHEKIMHTRLQELNTVYQRIVRIVRDTSRILGKKVVLDLDGGEVELDKTMIDTILDALVHILRNSIDHGIESPEERRKVGKSEVGKISVSASLQTGNVKIIIEDDGRGLNIEKIKSSSIAKGQISKEEADKLSKEEIEELIFLPGITTKDKVTETSGRGVGMDVVRTSFKRIGGSVHLTSQEGKGVKIFATIPQTVSVISCLLISVNHRKFALFQKYISELLRFDPTLYSVVNGHRMYRLREKLLPIIHLGELLFPGAEFKEQSTYIVVVKSDNYYFGLLFDEMLGTEEIVIKPLGEHFAGIKLFSGATIMGDGEAVLILDVFGIADFSGLQTSIQDNQISESTLSIQKMESGYLLFEVSGQQFAVLTSSVVCIEKIFASKIEILSGIEVIQYKGELVPIVHLEEIYSISRDDSMEECYVIIIDINSKNFGVLIHRIVDVINDIHIIHSDTLRGESVIGHSLINGKATIVIDVIELLTKLIKERFSWLGTKLGY